MSKAQQCIVGGKVLRSYVPYGTKRIGEGLVKVSVERLLLMGEGAYRKKSAKSGYYGILASVQVQNKNNSFLPGREC